MRHLKASGVPNQGLGDMHVLQPQGSAFLLNDLLKHDFTNRTCRRRKVGNRSSGGRVDRGRKLTVTRHELIEFAFAEERLASWSIVGDAVQPAFECAYPNSEIFRSLRFLEIA